MVNPEAMTLSEEFIIQISLIGLGLLLTLYTLIVPHLKKQLISKQVKNFKKSYIDLNTLLNKFKDNISNSAFHNQLEEKILNLKKYTKLPFWIIWGVLSTLIFLSLSCLLPLFNLMGIQIPYLTIENLLGLTKLFLILGIIFFIIISFKVFIELKDMLSGEFEEELEKAKKLIKKAEKVEEKIKKKIKKK